MRKQKVLKDTANPPLGFIFAVCESRSGAEEAITAWFKTEQDAKIFAEAEKKIAELKTAIERERQNTTRVARSSYLRGCNL